MNKDPLDEQIYGLMMRSYLGMGYPSKAILIYSDAQRNLSNQLEVHKLADEFQYCAAGFKPFRKRVRRLL